MATRMADHRSTNLYGRPVLVSSSQSLAIYHSRLTSASGLHGPHGTLQFIGWHLLGLEFLLALECCASSCLVSTISSMLIFLCKSPTIDPTQCTMMEADITDQQRRFCRSSEHHASISHRSWIPSLHSPDVCKPRHTVGRYPARLSCGHHDPHTCDLLVLRRYVTAEKQDHGQSNMKDAGQPHPYICTLPNLCETTAPSPHEM